MLRGRRVRATVWTAAAIGLFVGLFAWGLSSPPGSSPDDNFHLTSIYCASGQAGKYCHRTDDGYLVPEALIDQCSVFKSDVSGACRGDEDESLRDDPYVQNNWWNHTHNYPPVFYAAMTPFVSDDLTNSVVAMRTVNVAVFVVLLGAVLVLLPAALRPPVMLGVVATIVPLAAFVIPSTNPSSWAIVSAATVWPALLGHLRTTGRRSWALGGLAVVGTVVGAGARADAATYAVLAVIVVGVLELRRSNLRWSRAIVPGIVVAVSALLYLTAEQGELVQGGGSTGGPSLKSLVLTNLREIPYLVAGVFGHSPIGWMDTYLPPLTWVLAGGVFAALLFWGIGKTDWRKTLAVAGVVFTLWLVPLVILVQVKTYVPEFVQPRYILPLTVILAGVAALPVASGRPRLTGLQVGVVAAALTLANSAALSTNIIRYTTGMDMNRFNLDANVEWWWGSPVPRPMAVWLVGAVAMGIFFAATACLLWDASRDPDEPADMLAADGAAVDLPVPAGAPADESDAERGGREGAVA